MADPGMYGRLGKVPRRVKSNRTVRPPTEAGQANTLGWTRTAGSTSSIEFDVPSGGDIVLAAIYQGSGVFTPPAGWVSLGNADSGGDRMEVFYTLTPGVTATFTSTSVAPWFVDAISIAGSVDWATNPPEITLNTGTLDPPAISPTTAPGVHGVFSFFGHRKNFLAVPSGYAAVSSNSLVATGDPAVFDAFRLVDITTTEDPGVWGASVGGYPQIMATVAMLFETTAELATGDHNHDHGVLTGLADDDHSQYSLVAGTRAFTGEVAGVTPTVDASLATKGYVDGVGGVTDHGALTGLADDDHSQYLLAAGTRAATFLEVSGLTGATASSPRFVGGTLSGAPASGTFALGDYVVTEDGNIYVCTTAGTPGTWTAVGAGAATDADAIHDNVPGEVAALTEVTPVSGDWLYINDTSDSGNPKKVNASNFLGGGATVPDWIADLATPDSAHADDQEMTGTIGGTAVTPTGTVTWTQDEGLLSAAFDTQSSGDHCPRLYPLTPSAAPVTLTTRMVMLARRASNPMFGLCFTDGTTASSNAVAVGLYHTGTGPLLARWAGTLTSMTTTNLFTDLSYGSLDRWIYQRLVWVSSNTWAWAFSIDGVSWTDFGSATFAATLTPTHFGPWVSSWGVAYPLDAAFEYVRVAEADLSV